MSSTKTQAPAAAANGAAAPKQLANRPSKSGRTKQFREILVARSDGMGYTTQQINEASRAQPVSDPLDDSDEFYRSWVVKLGKAIKYNLGDPDDAAEYAVRIPEGYTLRIRQHSTRDRAGPYMFGHPLGPLSMFRSPAEVALHMLWLMSGSQSHADCSCRLCVKMVSDNAAVAKSEEAAAAAPAPAPAPVRRNFIPYTPDTTAAAAAAAAAAPATQATQPAIQATTPATTQGAAAGQVAARHAAFRTGDGTKSPAPKAPQPARGPAAPMPVLAPNTVVVATIGGSADLFRPWELVWYGHKQAWRLGIILQAEATTQDNKPFRVAPLAHSAVRYPELRLAQGEMRPFLSFSVPDMREESLKGKVHDEVNWAELARAGGVGGAQAKGQQSQAERNAYMESLALEASKAAANQINASFSLFNELQKTSASQCMYGGMFLGAEQIRVGDAVRVKVQTGDTGTKTAPLPAPGATDVMRVNYIYSDGGQVKLIGDVYRPISLPASAPAAAIAQLRRQQPPGAIFEEEMRTRNDVAVAAATGGQQELRSWYWQPVERNGGRGEVDVYGRFYATVRLLDNLQQRQQAQAQQAASALPDATRFLNQRLQTLKVRYLGRRPNRAAMIGGALTTPLPPVEGINEPAGVV